MTSTSQSKINGIVKAATAQEEQPFYGSALGN